MKIIVGGLMSIDGKIAPPNKMGKLFSSFMTKRHQKILHQLRSQVDAVIVGVNTIILDDPLLTVRAVKGKNPIRIILDSTARIPMNAQVLSIKDKSTIIAVTERAPVDKIEALKRKGANIIMTGSHSQVDLRELTDKLSKKGINRILVEGGGEVRWSFFKENLVNEFFVWIVPYILGGRRSPTLVDGEGFLDPVKSVPLRIRSIRMIENIIIMWFSINDSTPRKVL